MALMSSLTTGSRENGWPASVLATSRIARTSSGSTNPIFGGPPAVSAKIWSNIREPTAGSDAGSCAGVSDCGAGRESPRLKAEDMTRPPLPTLAGKKKTPLRSAGSRDRGADSHHHGKLSARETVIPCWPPRNIKVLVGVANRSRRRWPDCPATGTSANERS